MVDMTNDVIRFEQMFADRFTEKDNAFMELKSKSLPNPVVIYPWKTPRKQWNKRWDYSHRRNQDDRGHRERGNYKNDDRGHRERGNYKNDDRGQRERGNYKNDDRHRQNSYDRHHDRARGENSREGYRDRSEDGRQDRNRDSQDRSNRQRERKFDFHSSIKAYQDK